MAKLDDTQLMALLDEELDATQAAALRKEVAASAEAQAKLASLSQVGDVMRAYYENAVEAKSAQLDSMWWRLEEALEKPPESKREPAGVWSWLFARRAHFVTGLIGALGGALIVMATRQPTVVVYPAQQTKDGGTHVISAVAESDVIEELEVVGGTGTVMQIPSENKNDTDTTVIWITLSDTEGPI